MNVLSLDGGATDIAQMAKHFPVGTELTQVSGRECRASFDNVIFQGVASSIDLPTGLHMTVSDFQGHQPFSIAVEHNPVELEFAFCRTPGLTATGPTGEDLALRPGEFQICSVRESTRLRLDASPGVADQTVRLTLSSQSMCDLLGMESPPQELGTLLSKSSSFSSLRLFLDPAIEAAVDSILEAAKSSSVGRGLFLQAKAMELLALASDRLVQDQEEAALPGDQVERLHRAKSILLANLESPPSVSELAKRVHMGERQLKTGFKTLFGAPIMTFARRAKMDRARTLLSARRYNVTQVAQLIGYANPSKFAAAYRRQFGVSPSAA